MADTIRIIIEDTAGERFECDISRDTSLSKLAEEYFQDRGWHTRDARGREHPVVVELVDLENPDRTKRLDGQQTADGAGLFDGAVLRMFPEAVAGCFPGIVKVSLADGQRKLIQDIKVGDVLLCGIPGSKTLTTTEVTQIFSGFARSYLTLNGMLHITESHPVCSNGQWVTAGKLKVGDLLQDRHGNEVRLESIAHQSERVEVHNLHVSSVEHTFFAEDILVHNADLKSQLSEWQKRHSPREVTINPVPPYDVMQVKVPLPALLTIGELFNSVMDRLEAIEFYYSIFALLSSSDSEAISNFISHLKEQNNSQALSADLLRRFLTVANLEPLRVKSLHYGSPASFDLLGLGKVLEILRDTLKGLVWRVKHERQMADLERQSKQVQIEKEKMEIERSVLQIVGQKMELLERTTTLKLSDNERNLILSVILPKLLPVVDNPVTTLSQSDLNAKTNFNSDFDGFLPELNRRSELDLSVSLSEKSDQPGIEFKRLNSGNPHNE